MHPAPTLAQSDSGSAAGPAGRRCRAPARPVEPGPRTGCAHPPAHAEPARRANRLKRGRRRRTASPSKVEKRTSRRRLLKAAAGVPSSSRNSSSSGLTSSGLRMSGRCPPSAISSSLASGSSPAIARAVATGTGTSPSPWTTSVGHATLPRSRAGVTQSSSSSCAATTSGDASRPIAIISSVTASEAGSVKTACMNGTMKPGQSFLQLSSRSGSGADGLGSSRMYGAIATSRVTRCGCSAASSTTAFSPREAVTIAARCTPVASITASASAAWSGKS